MYKKLFSTIAIATLFSGCLNTDWSKTYNSFHEGNIEEWTPMNVFGSVPKSQARPDRALDITNLTETEKAFLRAVNDYRSGIRKCGVKRYNQSSLKPGVAISKLAKRLDDIMLTGQFSLGSKPEDKDIVEEARKKSGYKPVQYGGILSWTTAEDIIKRNETATEEGERLAKEFCKLYTKTTRYKWIGIDTQKNETGRVISILFGT